MWVRILILLGMVTAVVRAGEPINVSAAISLKEVMETVAAQYEKQSGTPVKLVLGGSGELATQIENGAGVDVFVSAAQKQVDRLIEKGVADKNSKTVICKNELVLITPAANTGVSSFENLTDDAVKRIAIAEPKNVPAGEYAAETLKNLKLFDKLESKLIYGVNVRQVLDYVRRGEVEAGLVYRTDAMVAKDAVRVAGVADASWHAPIEYPAVTVLSSKSKEEAAKFVAYLRSEAGQAEFCKRGFATTTPPQQEPAK